MLKIVMIMLCGIGTGYLLRNKKMSFIGDRKSVGRERVC